MSVSFFDELSTLSRTKKIISLLPQRARLRVAKTMYDYESSAINGIDIVAPLQNDGLVCFINTKDLIGWKIFLFGEYESGTNKALAKYIKKDDIVIEAGANLGSETLLISRMVGEKGHIYGFEPNPYTYNRLSFNVAINQLKNANVYDLAIGEADKEISFNIYPKGFCNPGMSSKYVETSITEKITVKQMTLDSFVKANNVPRVDFIKMDIQGAEMDLLVGAASILAKYKPTIFTEALQEYNDVKELYKILDGYGYTVSLIEENGLVPMTNITEARDGNWLAVNKEKKGK